MRIALRRCIGVGILEAAHGRASATDWKIGRNADLPGVHADMIGDMDLRTSRAEGSQTANLCSRPTRVNGDVWRIERGTEEVICATLAASLCPVAPTDRAATRLLFSRSKRMFIYAINPSART